MSHSVRPKLTAILRHSAGRARQAITIARASRAMSGSRVGSTMAKEGQSGVGGLDAIAGAARQAARQGAAAGAPVESALLRRSRHADRRRRHLVLPQDADRPAGAGEAVRLGAQARGRPVLPGHAGGEMRHHRRRRAVPGGRDAGRAAERPGRVLQFPHQCRRLGRLRARASAALRAGGRHRRAQALSACAARSVGAR